MEILETKGRKMNKIKREERENLHTFSDTTLTDCSLRISWYEYGILGWYAKPKPLRVL